MTFSTTLNCALAAIAIAALPAASAAQVLKPAGSPQAPSRPQTTTPINPGAASNPKGSSIATAQPVVSQTLTVRYLVDAAFPVALFADGLTFSCAPEPASPTPVTACVAKTSGSKVELSATYGKGSPLTPIVPKVSGKQWSGACSGTPGDTCRLTMTGPQTVGIDFYAKP